MHMIMLVQELCHVSFIWEPLSSCDFVKNWSGDIMNSMVDDEDFQETWFCCSLWQVKRHAKSHKSHWRWEKKVEFAVLPTLTHQSVRHVPSCWSNSSDDILMSLQIRIFANYIGNIWHWHGALIQVNPSWWRESWTSNCALFPRPTKLRTTTFTRWWGNPKFSNSWFGAARIFGQSERQTVLNLNWGCQNCPQFLWTFNFQLADMLVFVWQELKTSLNFVAFPGLRFSLGLERLESVKVVVLFPHLCLDHFWEQSHLCIFCW